MPSTSTIRLLRRNDSNDPKSNSSMINLLITLVVLIAFGIILSGTLFVLRRHRHARKAAGMLPTYDAANRNHNKLKIHTNQDTTFSYSEKQQLIDDSSPMPLSPENVPEIRITFPEEEDSNGRRVSGRVMVVQVGEAGVGFIKPIDNRDSLPPYDQAHTGERYASVDLEKIGGLKELR